MLLKQNVGNSTATWIRVSNNMISYILKIKRARFKLEPFSNCSNYKGFKLDLKVKNCSNVSAKERQVPHRSNTETHFRCFSLTSS